MPNLDPDLFNENFVFSLQIYPFLPIHQNDTAIAQIVNLDGVALELSAAPDSINL